MSRDTAKAFFDPGPGEPQTGYITPADQQAAIDVIYDDLGKVAAGFVSLASSGAVNAGSAYTVYIPTGLPGIVGGTASFRMQSFADPGYQATATATRKVNAVVSWDSGYPGTLIVTLFFPEAFTVDARGQEGVAWVAYGGAGVQLLPAPDPDPTPEHHDEEDR